MKKNESNYNAIDLGLPSGLLWADRNIGASTEEDAGLYFQWGSVKGRTPEELCHINSDGKLHMDIDWNYIKKQYNSSCGNKRKVLLPQDDAATANMGYDWRMPTRNEMQELISHTDVILILENGDSLSLNKNRSYMFTQDITGDEKKIRGIKFCNKKDHSKYIFIPAAGEFDYANLMMYHVNFAIEYWLSTVRHDTNYQWKFRFYSMSDGRGDGNVCNDFSCCYFPVRGVYGANKIEIICFDKSKYDEKMLKGISYELAKKLASLDIDVLYFKNYEEFKTYENIESLKDYIRLDFPL